MHGTRTENRGICASLKNREVQRKRTLRILRELHTRLHAVFGTNSPLKIRGKTRIFLLAETETYHFGKRLNVLKRTVL